MKFADDAFVFLSFAEVRAFLSERRVEANILRSNFDDRGAALTEKFAAELESFVQARADDSVTVNEASVATGFSTDHIRRRLSTGDLTNVGVAQRPAIRRGDLHPKRKKTLARESAGSYDVAADVRALRIRRGE